MPPKSDKALEALKKMFESEVDGPQLRVKIVVDRRKKFDRFALHDVLFRVNV